MARKGCVVVGPFLTRCFLALLMIGPRGIHVSCGLSLAFVESGVLGRLGGVDVGKGGGLHSFLVSFRFVLVLSFFLYCTHTSLYTSLFARVTPVGLSSQPRTGLGVHCTLNV